MGYYLPTTTKTSRKKPNKPKQSIKNGIPIRWTNDKVDIYIRTIKNKGVCRKGHYKGSYEQLSRLTGFTKQQCRSFWSDTKKMNSRNKTKLWMKMYNSASIPIFNTNQIELITSVIIFIYYYYYFNINN